MPKVMISGEGECIPVEKSELPPDAVLVNEIAEYGGCRCEVYHAELKGYTEYYVVFTDDLCLNCENQNPCREGNIPANY